MTPADALRRIRDEAEDYAKSSARFAPNVTHEALKDNHIYRQGVRDGKNQAARVAVAGLEGEA